MKLTQEAAIARDKGRLAEEAERREIPGRPLLEQTTLECAKENPSDLGDRVCRLEAVAVTKRFAVSVDDTSKMELSWTILVN